VQYNRFEKSGDTGAFDRAIEGERRAIEAWRDLVEAAGDRFADDLMMGARSRNLCGHWRDELKFLEQAFQALEKQRQAAGKGWMAARKPAPTLKGSDTEPPVMTFKPVAGARPGEALRITATAHDPSGVKWVRLRYRNVTQFEDYQTLEMQPTDRPAEYAATVPGDRLSEEWDFMYFFEVMDRAGNGKIYPDLEKEAPYIIVELER